MAPSKKVETGCLIGCHLNSAKYASSVRIDDQKASPHRTNPVCVIGGSFAALPLGPSRVIRRGCNVIGESYRYLFTPSSAGKHTIERCLCP